MRIPYAVRRLLQVVPALAVVLVVTFALVVAAPRDPVLAKFGDEDIVDVAAERHSLGLDRPLRVQFARYVGGVIRGDLGRSFITDRPVANEISAFAGPTLLLTGTAMVLSTFGGIVLGISAARRPFSRSDLGVGFVSLVGYAVPVFWLAQVAQYFFALRVPLFPYAGMIDAHFERGGLSWALDVAHHLILPALVLAASELALLARVTRAGLLGELGKDFVRTARAKGLTEPDLLIGHALRNAMLPVLTLLGTRVGFLLSGAVLVESAFGWPGLGRRLVVAMETGDRPLVLGVVLLVATAVILANLITDLLYAWADPRVRLG